MDVDYQRSPKRYHLSKPSKTGGCANDTNRKDKDQNEVVDGDTDEKTTHTLLLYYTYLTLWDMNDLVHWLFNDASPRSLSKNRERDPQQRNNA